MNKKLEIYLNRKKVGILEQNQDGALEFYYLPEYLEAGGSMALSCSLPLQNEKFKQKECRAFFAGILPEESNRDLVAKILGISAKNDYSMLKQLGGDCAGALTFLPWDENFLDKKYDYQKISPQDFKQILLELPRNPLLASKEDIRLSLAGVQDKIAIYFDKQQIYLPLNGAPTSHIIKPANKLFKHIVENEFLSLNLAKKIGIYSANAQIRNIDEDNYLMIERYDRVKKRGGLYRLHQEDFCQALGITPENKYQNEGGPNFAQCFELLRKTSSMPALDIQNLLNIIIFNLIIGNNDAHGKNFSLIYNEEGAARLAPAYDLVATAYYENLSQKMAMKFGSAYEFAKLKAKDIEQFAQDANLSKILVKNRIIELSTKVIKICQESDNFKELWYLIEHRAKLLIAIAK